MVKKSLKKLILKKYYTLSFPHAFGGVSSFRRSLKDNLDIDISHAALRRVLKSSLPYQINVIKSKKFPTRKLYTQGCFMEAYADPLFVNFKGTKKKFIFLMVVDVHSRMLYSTKLSGSSNRDLKKAFTRLFRAGMPKFPILRVDRDLAYGPLAHTYFAKQGILMRVRRSVHAMGFMEGIARNVKRKFILNLRQNPPPNGWTEKQLELALKAVTENYNSSISSSHGYRPKDVIFCGPILNCERLCMASKLNFNPLSRFIRRS